MSNIELIQQRDQKIAELLDELAELKQQKSLVVDTNKMVDNFLSWKLPSDFSPDGGIRFNMYHLNGITKHEPAGTHLFHALSAWRSTAISATENLKLNNLTKETAKCRVKFVLIHFMVGKYLED
jgi:hypothetical protein